MSARRWPLEARSAFPMGYIPTSRLSGSGPSYVRAGTVGVPALRVTHITLDRVSGRSA